jgi:hydroxymethylpyrimidine pyrophosphatase-like HAD family hydrolase
MEGAARIVSPTTSEGRLACPRPGRPSLASPKLGTPLKNAAPFSPIAGSAKKPPPPKIERNEIDAEQHDDPIATAMGGFIDLFVSVINGDVGDQEWAADELKSAYRVSTNQKPRIEIRRAEKVCKPGEKAPVANLALAFPHCESRDRNLQQFITRGNELGLSVVAAGSTTVEVGIKGVDKGVCIAYIANNLVSGKHQ